MALSIAPLGGRLDAAWAAGAVRRERPVAGGAAAAAAPFALVPAAQSPSTPAGSTNASAAPPADALRANGEEGAERTARGEATEGGEPAGGTDASTKPGPQALTPEEQAVVRELKARDAQVRVHEQAHVSAAAGLSVSGPTYSFQRGPDGRNYAVGGEVRIDTSEEDTPRETADKAQRIQAAALAPADPSPQDRAVAAAAAQMEQRALAQISAERRAQVAANQATASNAGEGVGTRGSVVTPAADDPAAPAAPTPFTARVQQRLAQSYGSPEPRSSRWLAAA